MKKNSGILSIKSFVIFYCALLISLPCVSQAQKKTIAITIDDLPFVGEYRNFHLNMMMKTLVEKEVPATGFIIASEVRNDNWSMLQKFREAGFGLGNHTFSHANLGRLATEASIQEIKKANTLLEPVLTEPKYFRYPYLSMGAGTKKDKILCYLAENNYHVAPITIDSKDFAFNQRLLATPELARRDYLNELKPFYLDFILQQTIKAEEHTEYHHNTEQAQILLIHANLLNAYVLPDIINLYKQQGYQFISLEEALKSFKYQFTCPTKQIAQQTIAPKAQIKAKEIDDLNSELSVAWD